MEKPENWGKKPTRFSEWEVPGTLWELWNGISHLLSCTCVNYKLVSTYVILAKGPIPCDELSPLGIELSKLLSNVMKQKPGNSFRSGWFAPMGTCSNSCLWHQLHSLRYLEFGAFSSHIHFGFIILNDSTSSRLCLACVACSFLSDDLISLIHRGNRNHFDFLFFWPLSHPKGQIS